MLPRYRTAVEALSPQDRAFLVDFFRTPPFLEDLNPITIYDDMHAAGLSQADVVLALLHAGRIDAVELFVHIQHIPMRPVRRRPQPPAEARVTAITFPARETRRVRWLRQLRRGMTMAQIAATGMPRRVVRWALRHHYLEFA